MSDFDDPSSKPYSGQPYSNEYKTSDNLHWRDSWDYRTSAGNHYYEQGQKTAAELAQLSAGSVAPSSSNPGFSTGSSSDFGDYTSSESPVRYNRSQVAAQDDSSKAACLFLIGAAMIAAFFGGTGEENVKSIDSTQKPNARVETPSSSSQNIKSEPNKDAEAKDRLAIRNMGLALEACYTKDAAFHLALENEQQIKTAFSDMKFGPKVGAVVKAFKETRAKKLPVSSFVDDKTAEEMIFCGTTSETFPLQPGLRGTALRKLETILNNCQKANSNFSRARAERHPKLKVPGVFGNNDRRAYRIEKIRLGNVLTEEGLEEVKLYRKTLDVKAVDDLKECSWLGEDLAD